MSNKKLFILLLASARGQGNTTLGLATRAILQLGGRDHLGLDANPRNNAFKERSGVDLLTKTIGADAGPDKAPGISSTAGGLPVIMDMGAGLLSSGAPIAQLVPALQSRFQEEGYRTVALLPLSPNKIGAVGALVRLAPQLLNFEKFVVLNDQDGSSEFQPATNGLPVINVPNLQSGPKAYLFRSERQIFDVIVNPDPGCEKVSVAIAHWVRGFASEPAILDLLGADLCERALSRLPPPPVQTRFVHQKLEQIGNSSYQQAEYMQPIWDLIDQFGWSPEGLRLAADELERRQAALRVPILRVPSLYRAA